MFTAQSTTPFPSLEKSAYLSQVNGAVEMLRSINSTVENLGNTRVRSLKHPLFLSTDDSRRRLALGCISLSKSLQHF